MHDIVQQHYKYLKDKYKKIGISENLVEVNYLDKIEQFETLDQIVDQIDLQISRNIIAKYIKE